jgi:hypothetical protein
VDKCKLIGILYHQRISRHGVDYKVESFGRAFSEELLR